MSYELIATIIFLGSIFGMGVILFRKIPVLAELALEITEEKEGIFSRLKDEIKNLFSLKSSSPKIFLQRILSKIRILALKTESKTSTLLERLRTKKRGGGKIENDNYWEELKKSANRGDKKSSAWPRRK